MGMVKIEILGSFGRAEATFSAMKSGHADAVAQAIEWLSRDVLPKAIANDHKCHDENAFPEYGFAKRNP